MVRLPLDRLGEQRARVVVASGFEQQRAELDVDEHRLGPLLACGAQKCLRLLGGAAKTGSRCQSDERSDVWRRRLCGRRERLLGRGRVAHCKLEGTEQAESTRVSGVPLEALLQLHLDCSPFQNACEEVYVVGARAILLRPRAIRAAHLRLVACRERRVLVQLVGVEVPGLLLHEHGGCIEGCLDLPVLE